MVQLQPQITTNAWVTAAWDEFLEAVDQPDYASAKAYYFNNQMRLETMGVGPDHAADNSIIHVAIILFCALRALPIRGLINCSYRQTGVGEAQPDISYYVGEQAAPQGSAIVNLDQQAPPDLVIEIADSSLSDDLGKKRLLYEALKVPEYWVVDVEKAEILAFQIIPNGSQRVTQSQVLPGLEIALLQAALLRCRQQDDSQVTAWLISQFR